MPSGVYERTYTNTRRSWNGINKKDTQFFKVWCLKGLHYFKSQSKFIRICEDCKRKNEGIRLDEAVNPDRSYRFR